MRLSRGLPLTLLPGTLVFAAPAMAGPASLQRGFADKGAFFGLADGEGQRALNNARLAGASFVRLAVAWRGVAPPGRRKPRGFRASDPADPRYAWGALDRAVRKVKTAGLEPLMLVNSAPDWAEGPGRRRQGKFTRPGVWRPMPRELDAFFTAAARR